MLLWFGPDTAHFLYLKSTKPQNRTILMAHFARFLCFLRFVRTKGTKVLPRDTYGGFKGTQCSRLWHSSRKSARLTSESCTLKCYRKPWYRRYHSIELAKGAFKEKKRIHFKRQLIQCSIQRIISNSTFRTKTTSVCSITSRIIWTERQSHNR